MYTDHPLAAAGGVCAAQGEPWDLPRLRGGPLQTATNIAGERANCHASRHGMNISWPAPLIGLLGGRFSERHEHLALKNARILLANSKSLSFSILMFR